MSQPMTSGEGRKHFMTKQKLGYVENWLKHS
jgi:hypothetical protein